MPTPPFNVYAGALAALLTLSSGFAQTTDPSDASWSRFRGPNGTGIAESGELPAAIGPKQNVIWRKELPTGHSSPILSAEHIFLTGAEKDEIFTFCIERKTGETVWKRKAPRSRVSKLDHRNNAASPSAAVDEDVIVVFFNDFGIVGYDHSGKELWQQALGPFNNVYGMGASPVLYGDHVFLACDQQTNSFLIALDKTTGKTLWRVDRKRAASGHCTPIIYEPDLGGAQLILPGSFFLDAYDMKTGERIWWVGGLSFEMKSVPVLHKGIIYTNGYGSPLNNPGTQIKVQSFTDVIGSNDKDGDKKISQSEMIGGRAGRWFPFVDLDADKLLDAEEWNYLSSALASRNGILAITPGGKGDMTEKSVKWSYHRSIPQLPSPLIYGDVLYLLNDQGGLMTLLDPSTGKVIEKGRLKDAQDNYYSSPVAGDGKIYIFSEGGIATVLKKGGGFEALSTAEFDEGCYATPAIADGRIYVRTVEALYCFGIKER